jgi:hypothetical protein
MADVRVVQSRRSGREGSLPPTVINTKTALKHYNDYHHPQIAQQMGTDS